MAAKKVVHLGLDERRARGREARETCPRSSHGKWRAAADRPDPIALLEEQNRTRDPDLVPVRHGRMMVSPFTFYRGAARIMAADLAGTPVAGLDAQLCGDAHLSNFGMFASPERRLVFDLNDFDETLPGPFEFDVKRMAASFTIAARHNGFSDDDERSSTLGSVAAYREAMATFAGMRTMDIWYTHLDAEEVMASLNAEVRSKGEARLAARAKQTLDKARTRDSLQALSKLAEFVDGRYRIVSQPPVIVPARDIREIYDMDPDEVVPIVHSQFREYRATLLEDRRHLLEQFRFEDAARKVVGVGSVGTRAFIVLLSGRDEQDPLFLQVKEATNSVLENHLPRSRFRHHGQRVVAGQRLMQATSDIFLGWSRGADVTRHFYWRQLRDMKGSAVVEDMVPRGLQFYARMCGWTLARAHARSGDPVAIASYLGKSDAFDRGIADFGAAYAAQNQRDYDAFLEAIRSGRLEATEGV